MHTLPDLLVTPRDYNLYWENIAMSNKAIAHDPLEPNQQRFYNDMNKLVGTSISGLILVVIPHPTYYSNGHYDNIFEIPRYDFMVLRSIGQNFDLLDTAINETKVVHDQILSKLINDSEPGANPRRITYFKIEEVTTDCIDIPFAADGWVGYSSSVPMGNPNQFNYNPDEWL